MSKTSIRKVRILNTVMAAVLLAGCGTVSKNINDDGTHAKELIWPQQTDLNPLAKEGSYPTQQSLMLLQPGLSKTQVQKLIGPPQFSEGIATREWNYLFHISNAQTKKFETCQYKVFFSKSGKVGSQYWLPENCGYIGSIPTDQRLQTDGLFKFDQWQFSQLDSESMGRLETFSRQVQATLSPNREISITAYTDRLGSADYNQLLSERRATAIKHFLMERGIPASQITTYGAGDTKPLSKGCNASLKQSDLISCLSPDRRVEIDVK